MEYKVNFISKILQENFLPFKISTKSISPSPPLYLIDAKSLRRCVIIIINIQISPIRNGKSKNSHQRRSIKNSLLKNFAIFTGKHLCYSLFLINLQSSRPVLSCESCEVFVNTHFQKPLQTVASKKGCIAA